MEHGYCAVLCQYLYVSYNCCTQIKIPVCKALAHSHIHTNPHTHTNTHKTCIELLIYYILYYMYICTVLFILYTLILIQTYHSIQVKLDNPSELS